MLFQFIHTFKALLARGDQAGRGWLVFMFCHRVSVYVPLVRGCEVTVLTKELRSFFPLSINSLPFLAFPSIGIYFNFIIEVVRIFRFENVSQFFIDLRKMHNFGIIIVRVEVERSLIRASNAYLFYFNGQAAHLSNVGGLRIHSGGVQIQLRITPQGFC